MSPLVQQPMLTLWARLTAVLAIVVILLPSAAYWLHVQTSIIEQLEESLRVQGLMVEDFIATRPDHWDLASDRLRGLLERQESAHSRFTVFNQAGEILIESARPASGPAVTRSRTLHAFGKPVGRLAIEKEMEGELQGGLPLLLASLTIAWLIWSPLRRLPLRALAASETELRARDQYQRALLDNFPFVVWLKDTESRFLAVNARFADTFGQPSAASLIGKTDLDITTPELAEAYRADDQAVLASGKPRRVEELIETSGERRWFETYKSPVSLGGKVIGTVGYARDITESRLAVDALRESEERFRSLLQHVDSIALQGYLSDGTTRFWNPASEKLYGYTAAEAIGRNLLDLIIPPEMREGVRQGIEEMFRGGVAIRPAELSLQRKDGSRVAVFSSHVLVQVPGKAAEMFCIDIDLTERNRAAAELEQHRYHLEELVQSRTTELAEAKEAAEAASRSKSTFLANMSHEIRTPMNAIIGLTHLLQQQTRGRKQLAQLGKVSDAAQHLLSIINDILDLSKIEVGRLTLEETDFSLSLVIDHTLSMLGERSRAKSLELHKEIDPEIPAQLRGDPLRLGQILLNFVTNAVKFSEHGRVTVRARLLEAHAATALLRIEVEDQGIGLSEAAQANLFQAFAQADETTTRKYGGTGLGLAISKRLATMMSGEIGVSSQAGVGSTFWFTARLGRVARPERPGADDGAGAKADSPAGPPAVAVPADQILRRYYQGVRLLLVEDDPVNQEVARELLVAAGLRVDVVDNGQQAVERLCARMSEGEDDYALVLMDVQMPVMDGLQATRLIRQKPERATLPIVAITANAFAEDRQRCLAAGMSDHLAKPVNPIQLYEVLLHWLPESAALARSRAESRTPAPAGTELHAALAHISGLDIEAGSQMAGDDLGFYARLLRMFATQHGDDASRMRALIAAGERAEAERKAHTLKGVAATIGAGALRERALDLELALREGVSTSGLQPAIDALENELVPLAAAIASFHPLTQPSTDPLQQEADKVRVQGILAQLETLLAEDDTRAVDIWYGSAAILEAVLGPLATRLGDAINSFDFAHALHTLRQVQQGRDSAHADPADGA